MQLVQVKIQLYINYQLYVQNEYQATITQILTMHKEDYECITNVQHL